MKAVFNIEVEFQLMEEESVTDETLVERIRVSAEESFMSKHYLEDLNIRITDAVVKIEMIL